MNHKILIFTLSQIRKISFSTAINQSKNHYESLGVAKNATQSDIKGAYYKLSKVYHPDKNRGHTQDQRDQHSQKFRDITEAYEVLGNIRSRKMYDQGFLGATSHTEDKPHQTTPEDPLHKFYQSRERRSRPPPTSGTQTIYDFDEWAKQHYGNSVKRDCDLRYRKAFEAEQLRLRKENAKQEMIMLWGLLFVAMCMFFRAVQQDSVRQVRDRD